MPDAIPRSARARGRIAPAKMAHIVLRTNRYEEMIAWWSAVLELEPLHANPLISFLTFDDEHHRVAILRAPDLKDKVPNAVGVDHFAYSYASITGDLLDEDTARLLQFFSGQQGPNVRWNWRPLPRQQLFRRGIGRNLAALETRADWVWFTDSDLMFREGCLDALASVLQRRRDALVFPEEEHTTDLLAEHDPLLHARSRDAQVLDIDTSDFVTYRRSRATGPLQIAHGDVCRAVGYCRGIRLYQTPGESFAKCHEDRAFRWLLRSQGVPLPIPGVYRIRHVHKGRYTGGASGNRLRTSLRVMQSRVRRSRAGQGR